jgi:FtsP/CotA-like multicopper oxidase with cupredoxin domain
MWLSRRLYALSWAAAAIYEAAANPLTAPTRKFEWTLSWEKYDPDGFSRDLILINGKFPGPKLELNEGDDVEILVHNKMPFNTTVHFHG